LDTDGLFADNTDCPVIEPPWDDFNLLRLEVDLNTKVATPIGHDWPKNVNPADNWEDQLRKKRWRRIFVANVPDLDGAGDDDPTQRLEYWVPPRAGCMDGETSSASQAQALAEHHRWTEAEMARLTDTLKLPERLKQVLCMAARLHDYGKSRNLWQRAMKADRDPASVERPLAKTTNRGSGHLGGYRHEFGAMIDALRHRDISTLNEEDRELVLHLIAAHHGRARPCIPAIDPDVIVPAALEKEALVAAQRFARLQHVWGPWGLAWFETLLRAADVKASRRLEENAND
jgi:CRISPR-associated endonuclease/helicase Cas3